MDGIFNGIRTSHELAKTLLAEPDSLITICVGEDECMAEKVKTVKTHANYDDCVAQKTIVCERKFEVKYFEKRTSISLRLRRWECSSHKRR